MSMNPPGLSFFSETLVPINASAAQKTPIADLQSQVDGFKSDWEAKAFGINSLADKLQFAGEVARLWQSISTTLITLSACGTPRTEILRQMKQSLDLAHGQLSCVLTKFKVEKAVFTTASAQFEQRASASSGRDFTPFMAPLRRARLAMEEKKTQLAQCVKLSMDPESITGAMPCLAHHSKGLSEAEQKELSDFVPDAVTGKAIDDIASGPAVVSGAINTALSGAGKVVKFLYLGALSETILVADPGNYPKLMAEARRALEGENPEFNKGAKKLTFEMAKGAGKVVKVLALSALNDPILISDPGMEEARRALNGPEFNAAVKKLASKSGQLIASGIEWTNQIDEYTQARYRTTPGLVRAGIIGTAELAPAAIVPAFRGSVSLARMANRGVQATAQRLSNTSLRILENVATDITEILYPRLNSRVLAFARSEMGGGPPPKFPNGFSENSRFKLGAGPSPKFIPPEGWKAHTSQYFKCEFQIYETRISQMKVSIPVKKFSDTVLYIHPSKFRGTISTKYKIPTPERIQWGFKALVELADKHKLSRVLVAYDSELDAFASFLEAQGIPIRSMGTLSTAKSKILTVAEISVAEARALLKPKVNPVRIQASKTHALAKFLEENSTLRFPSEKKVIEFLEKHPLLQSSYLSEKEIVLRVARHLGNTSKKSNELFREVFEIVQGSNLGVAPQTEIAISMSVASALEDLGIGKIMRFIKDESGALNLSGLGKRRKATISVKKVSRLTGHQKFIYNDSKLVSDLRKNPSLRSLDDFSLESLNLDECVVHIVKNDQMKATLMLHRVDDCVVYYHRNLFKGERLISRTTNYTATQTLENILEGLFEFARLHNIPKLRVLSDPKLYPVASLLREKSLEITAVGGLTSTVGKPLNIIEVLVPEQRAFSVTASKISTLTKPPELTSHIYQFSVRQRAAVEAPKTKPATLVSKQNLAQNNFRLATTINKICQLQPDELVSFVLVDAFDTLAKLIPVYTQCQGLVEMVWWRALKSHLKVLNEVHYFKNFSDRSIALLKGSHRSLVVRDTAYIEEVLNELTSLEFLKSLHLRHLDIPDPLVCGQHGQTSTRYFLAKTYVEGPTMEELLQAKALHPLLDASRQAGMAVGELQSKHLGEPVLLARIKGATSDLLEKMDDLGIRTTKGLNKLIDDFHLSPGEAVYGIGDIKAGQFAYTNNRLGLFDAEQVNFSFTGAKTPVEIAAREYYKFFNMFEIQGIEAGLTRQEIDRLQQAFIKGYNAEFQGTRSAAAERFFEAYSHIDVAHYFMGNPAYKDVISHHINAFYVIIGSKKVLA